MPNPKQYNEYGCWNDVKSEGRDIVNAFSIFFTDHRRILVGLRSWGKQVWKYGIFLVECVPYFVISAPIPYFLFSIVLVPKRKKLVLRKNLRVVWKREAPIGQLHNNHGTVLSYFCLFSIIGKPDPNDPRAVPVVSFEKKGRLFSFFRAQHLIQGRNSLYL